MKPFLKRTPLFYCLFMVLISGCSKKKTEIPPSDVDVYIAGTYNIQDKPSRTIAYWKNNEPPTVLFTPLVFSGVATWDLDILNGEVLVAGAVDGIATLWKNGERIPLTTTRSEARDIFLSGNDIYIAGNLIDTRTRVGYWKNGVFTILGYYPTAYRDIAYCTSIAVDGNDVYAVGHYLEYTFFWKNGKLDTLARNTTPEPTAVKVANGNVYITGSLDTKAVYWKNNEPVIVADQGHVADIVLENGNIHLALNRGNSVYYWKNGVSTYVGEGDAYRLAVHGNDFYITGIVRGSNSTTAVYWKNGEKHRLTQSSDYKDHENATGIAIVPRSD